MEVAKFGELTVQEGNPGDDAVNDWIAAMMTCYRAITGEAAPGILRKFNVQRLASLCSGTGVCVGFAVYAPGRAPRAPRAPLAPRLIGVWGGRASENPE
jgi:hypothetical protein